MKSTDSANLFPTLIGASASTSYIRTIPATQGTSGDGTASIANGYPAETFVSPSAGGKFADGRDANGFLNLLSGASQSMQARGILLWDSAFAAAIGGYPLNAVIADAATGVFWVSTADDNTTTPGETDASWQSLFFGLAPLDSPALTGTPTVPTAASGTNTTQAASTEFVTSAVAAEATRASTVESNLQSTKAPLASPALTGTPTVPTASAGTRTTQAASTAFVGTATDAISQGRLLGVTTLTSSVTFALNPKTYMFRVRLLSGGGAGGGSVSNVDGTVTACSGGAAGGYVEAVFLVSALSGVTSFSCTIGAGGVGTTTTGPAGGTTSFGNLISDPGGNGGGVQQGSSTAAVVFAGQGGSGALPTVSSLAAYVIAMRGQPGPNGYVYSGGCVSGFGAPSQLGGGGGNTNSGAGNAATGYGAGGSGAAVGSGAAAANGGNGSPGIIIIEEFSA